MGGCGWLVAPTSTMLSRTSRREVRSSHPGQGGLSTNDQRPVTQGLWEGVSPWGLRQEHCSEPRGVPWSPDRPQPGGVGAIPSEVPGPQPGRHLGLGRIPPAAQGCTPTGPTAEPRSGDPPWSQGVVGISRRQA